MDPNEALEVAREHAALLNGDGCTTEEVVNAGLELAEAFAALDEWLSKEGFLPAAWAIAGERG